MVVKHKSHRLHSQHPLRKQMHKMVDAFADKVADKVVHELRESKKEERMEHRAHSKGCKCSKCKIHKKR